MLYLDNNARTRTDTAVVQAMLPYFTEWYGNPSSLHGPGRQAHAGVEQARKQVAALMRCQPSEVVFTSSGTEGDNTAVQSALAKRAGHVVVSACEHDAVLQPIREFEQQGWTVTRLKPGPSGLISPELVQAALQPDTRLVSVMAVNNECGVINPVEAIARVVSRHRQMYPDADVRFHVDASQAVGKTSLPLPALGVDYMVISAHKFYGPPGVGALLVRNGAPFVPLMEGGSQEAKRRAGTENTPGVVGLGLASDLARTSIPRFWPELAQLRDYIQQRILQMFGANVLILGAGAPRVPGTLLIALRGVMGRDVQKFLADRDIAVGTGSACSCLKNPQPSETVKAMDTPPEYAMGTVRISLGIYNLPSMGVPLSAYDALFNGLMQATLQPRSTQPAALAAPVSGLVRPRV